MEISEEDLKSAIEQSGYLLELRICPIFENLGYIVESSAQFQDQDTGKSRELDVHAWDFDFHNNRDHPSAPTVLVSDHIHTDIVVECKNNGLPLVFFSRQSRYPEIGTLLLGGNPPMLREYDDDLREQIELPLEQELKFVDFHQNWNVDFQAYKFARLEKKVHNRGSKTNEAIDWSLTHSGMSEMIDKVCKACQAMTEKRREEAKMDDLGVCEYSLYIVYPLVICSGEIYECRVSGDSYELTSTDHIQLNWNIESSLFKQDYRIHIVHEKALKTFLQRSRRDHDALRLKIDESVDRIYSSMKSYNLRHLPQHPE